MAEQENIELAKQQIAALNTRDLNAYVRRFDEAYIGQAETTPAPIRGPEGVRQYINTLLTAFPDLRVDTQEILATGDTVIVRMRATGTQKGIFAGFPPSSKPIVAEACNVFEVKNGKITRSRLYADNLSMLQQIGAVTLPTATAAARV